jgi:hypothetical protein
MEAKFFREAKILQSSGRPGDPAREGAAARAPGACGTDAPFAGARGALAGGALAGGALPGGALPGGALPGGAREAATQTGQPPKRGMINTIPSSSLPRNGRRDKLRAIPGQDHLKLSGNETDTDTHTLPGAAFLPTRADEDMPDFAPARHPGPGTCG